MFPELKGLDIKKSNKIITNELTQAGIPVVSATSVPWLSKLGLCGTEDLIGALKKQAWVQFGDVNTCDTHIVFERRYSSYSVYDANVPYAMAVELALSKHSGDIEPDGGGNYAGLNDTTYQLNYLENNVRYFDLVDKKYVVTLSEYNSYSEALYNPYEDNYKYKVDDELTPYFAYIHYYKIYSQDGLKFFVDMLYRYELIESS